MQFDLKIRAAIEQAMGLNPPHAEHRVVVAMSGGVDSSVTAVLLKLMGYDVVGITLQLYDQGEAAQRKGACCAGQDIGDARRVAQAFGFPHYVLDFEDRFRASVIDEFVDGYMAGTTPVPCVTCNRSVKFADLLTHAKALGAACLATGHYIESRARADGSGHRDLFTPADNARDQSYFLFATTQAQADYLRFPLGGLPKLEVRKLAAELGLAIADKPDSQDICFVPNGRYADVILKFRPDAAEPGDIVHLDGRVLGRHEGILNFTVGQRKGLGISGGDPLFVIRIDAETKSVIVGPREALQQKSISLTKLNWLGEGDEHDIPVFARTRSSRQPVPAVLRLQGVAPQVLLSQGESAIAPGQACVLYDGVGPGSRLLGGGTIALGAPHG